MNYERFYRDDDPEGYDSDDGHRLRPGFDYGDTLDYRGDAHDSGFNAPRIAPRWRMLRDLIMLVEGRFSPQAPSRFHTDDVQLGRDSDDWWIDVQYENAMFVSKYDMLAEDQVYRYRTVRDATLLLAIVARVDYEAFVALLIRRGKYDVPRFMNLQHHRLPPHFNFFFCQDLEPSHYAWTMLRDVFGDRDYGEEFMQLLEHVDEVAGQDEGAAADAAVRNARLSAPVKVKFTLRPERTALRNQVQILKNIIKTVKEIQQIEKNHRDGPSTQKLAPPVFHLDHLDLDLRAFSLHPEVLKLLEMLLQTGVRIASLTLPAKCEPSVGSELYVAWASFVTVALGVRTLPSQSVVALDHLVLPPLYTLDIFMTAFASALQHTTVLKSLRIEADRRMSGDSERQRRLWAALGYALFSVSSTHCVEKLDLSEHQLMNQALDILSQMTRSKSPNLLWMIAKGGNLSSVNKRAQGPMGTIQKGTMIKLLHCSESCGTIKLPTTFRGEILGANGSDLLMLVPGFGYVQAAEKAVQPDNGSRSYAVPRQGITKLVFNVKPKHPTPGATACVTRRLLPRLLEIIGGPLTSLGLVADDVDDSCVQTAIRSCPELEDLLIDSISVKSLAHVTTAYEQNTGGQPSSINLRNVGITRVSVDGFLKRLRTPSHPAHHRLRRLAIGFGWTQQFGPTTAELLDTMLAANRVLSHLYVYAGAELRWHPDNHGRNRERLPDVALPPASRFAFLMAIKRIHDSSASVSSRLPENALRLVLDFASQPVYRVAMREFGSYEEDDEFNFGSYHDDDDEFDDEFDY